MRKLDVYFILSKKKLINIHLLHQLINTNKNEECLIRISYSYNRILQIRFNV